MKQILLICALALLTLSSTPILADTDQIITLKDGSKIKGEVVSLSSGIYSVHSPTLGEIKVNASDIAAIANNTNAPQQSAPDSVQTQNDTSINQRIKSAQDQLLNDPQMMGELMEIMKDAELEPLLSDPGLVNKVLSNDIKAIEADPKAQELIKNPKMRALMDQMRKTPSASE